MAPGQVQIDSGVSELGVTKQNLDGAQVSACFQKVRCKAMA
jgi:hypothetical protein